MNDHAKLAPALLLAAALAAGCSSGSSSAPQSSDPPLAPGPAPASIDQVKDAGGNTVTANFASAIAVNDSNQVIGYAETTAGAPFTAARWSVSATGTAVTAPDRLAPLPGNSFSAAFAVDGQGNAVGQSSKGTQRVAVVWRAGASEPIELPALLATGNSAAFGITATGDVIVGEAQNAAGETRAVAWLGNSLGVFGAPPVVLPVNVFSGSSTFASASAVCRVGAEIWIVGQAEDGGGADHAALWRSADAAVFTATDLRRGELSSAAFALNASGVVVGEAETSAGVFVPSRWEFDQAGKPVRTDLAAAGTAAGVSASGRVAGTSGAGGMATVWSLPAGDAVSLFPPGNASQAYAINSANLVVGRQGSTGFVKRLE